MLTKRNLRENIKYLQIKILETIRKLFFITDEDYLPRGHLTTIMGLSSSNKSAATITTQTGAGDTTGRGTATVADGAMDTETGKYSHWRDIRDLNADFFSKLVKTLSMDEHVYTAIPSLAFLICSLIVVYFLTHKRTFIRGHSWKQIAFRELVFQWGYYYVTRLWIGFMKVLKWADTYCQHFFAQKISHDIEWIVHLVFLTIYTCISLLPLLIIINEKLNRPVIPNFMVWVGAHRWERTEMGMSGYYLDRPLRYVPMRTSIAYRSILPAYRTRRSCSADHAVFLQQIQTIQQQSSYQFLGEELDEVDTLIRTHHNARNGIRLRYVRSMEHVTPISNINDLIE